MLWQRASLILVRMLQFVDQEEINLVDGSTKSDVD